MRWNPASSSGRSYAAALSTARSPYGSPRISPVSAASSVWNCWSQRLAARAVAAAGTVSAAPDALAELEEVGDALGDSLPWPVRSGAVEGPGRVALRQTTYDVGHGRVDQPGQRAALAAFPVATASCSGAGPEALRHSLGVHDGAVRTAGDARADRDDQRGVLVRARWGARTVGT